jgi:anaerobic selenocysteine-containing dehydrogenase
LGSRTIASRRWLSIARKYNGIRSVWETLKNNLELHVVADFFMTPTAEIADYVLPAATWLERDDTCDIMYTNFISSRQKAIELETAVVHDRVERGIRGTSRDPWSKNRFCTCLGWES